MSYALLWKFGWQFAWGAYCCAYWAKDIMQDNKINRIVKMQEKQIELLQTEIRILKFPMEDFVVIGDPPLVKAFEPSA